jgi:hypothetical protein
MNDQAINVISNNLDKSVEYLYYVPDNARLTEQIRDFVNKLRNQLDVKYSDKNKKGRNDLIDRKMEYLKIYRYTEAPILCSFALLRDSNRSKNPAGYWYTINSYDLERPFFANITGSNSISDLELVFGHMKRLSWQQRSHEFR